MGLFETRGSKERKSAFMAAVSMTVQDGHVDECEIEACMLIARRLGCTGKEVRQVMENPASIEAIVPRSRKDRMANLLDILYVAMSDGEFSPEEQEAFVTIAQAYEVPADEVAAMMDAVSSGDIESYMSRV